MAHTFDEKTTAQLNRAKEHFEQMFGKLTAILRYTRLVAPRLQETTQITRAVMSSLVPWMLLLMQFAPLTAWALFV